jgi:hypothetical protein
MCKIVLLELVHCLNDEIIKKTKVSEAGFCFRLQVEKEGKRTESLPVGMVELASDLDQVQFL